MLKDRRAVVFLDDAASAEQMKPEKQHYRRAFAECASREPVRERALYVLAALP